MVFGHVASRTQNREGNGNFKGKGLSHFVSRKDTSAVKPARDQKTKAAVCSDFLPIVSPQPECKFQQIMDEAKCIGLLLLELSGSRQDMGAGCEV